MAFGSTVEVARSMFTIFLISLAFSVGEFEEHSASKGDRRVTELF